MSGEVAEQSSSLLAVGDTAPDFELRDQNNQRVSLSALRADGQVLLVFFPLAFTGTCQGELGYIRDHEPSFVRDGLRTVAISVGPPPTHKVWASAQGFLFPLLADFWPHGEVARTYGAFNEVSGYANRATFLVDRDGVIRFSNMLEPGQARDASLWDEALLAAGENGAARSPR
ncbi:redoxin domain-containing protein [Gordonia sp. HNM0687]|uniref:Alkyl hydroperoxide reductase E n=1 Tax=Gordonia mangrovi TaxID=2665643 RepID=A0A6L7GM85_9ACTN|nr:peroxiredoxin [Gordonia mangrovi]MXP21029.1 redoxin domain-containing protein [Gordonia mangrovi]